MDHLECCCPGEMVDEVDMLSEDGSSTNSGMLSLSHVTVRTNGSSIREECEDASDESGDGSEERFLWGWDLLDETGMNPDKCEEAIQVLKDVAVEKFKC